MDIQVSPTKSFTAVSSIDHDTESKAKTIIEEFSNLISDENIVELARKIEYVKGILQKDDEFREYMRSIEGKSLDSSYNSALDVIDNWKKCLCEGDFLDIQYKADKKLTYEWYHAKVVKRLESEILVHFMGWSDKYNQTLSLESFIMYPQYTFTTPKKKKDPTTDQPKNDEAIKKVWVSGVGYVDISDFVAITESLSTSRSGRKVKAVATTDPLAVKRSRKDKEVFLFKGREIDPYDKNDFLCATCDLLEADDHSDLILCDGPCLQSWHIGCMGINQNLIPEGPWLCEDCTSGKHKCAHCGVYGTDDIEVTKCSLKACGKYFHYGCLIMHDNYVIDKEPSESISREPTTLLNQINRDETTPADSNLMSVDQLEKILTSARPGSRQYEKALSAINKEKSHQTKLEQNIANSQFKFKCPYHFCDTCNDFYGETNKRKSSSNKRRQEILFKCIACPKAYHQKCISPGSRFNEMCLLCPNHPDIILPSANNQFQQICVGNLDLWDQMALPDKEPRADALSYDHFMLPLKIKLDVNSQPPKFKNIFRLDYDSYPGGEKAIPCKFIEECCQCVDSCDEACLNRILKVECYDAPGKRDQICNLSGSCDGNCGNRQFQKRDYVKVKPFQEGEMGWGLKTAEFVAKGTLVIEYLGDVINDEEMRTRMHNQRTFTPRDHDFYIMELHAGVFVDGKHKGNLSRFINHSCDPNCELVRWNVKGKIRIGIFAIRDVEKDEPLSYDYQFDTKESDAFKCHCGAKKCRGTMAPKSNAPIDKNNLSKEERSKLIATGKLREKRMEEQKLLDEMSRNYTGKNLPGDGFHQIKDGPLKLTFNMARATRVFLPRTARKGFKFIQRRDGMLKKSMKPASI